MNAASEVSSVHAVTSSTFENDGAFVVAVVAVAFVDFIVSNLEKLSLVFTIVGIL